MSTDIRCVDKNNNPIVTKALRSIKRILADVGLTFGYKCTKAWGVIVSVDTRLSVGAVLFGRCLSGSLSDYNAHEVWAKAQIISQREALTELLAVISDCNVSTFGWLRQWLWRDLPLTWEEGHAGPHMRVEVLPHSKQARDGSPLNWAQSGVRRYIMSTRAADALAHEVGVRWVGRVLPGEVAALCATGYIFDTTGEDALFCLCQN